MKGRAVIGAALAVVLAACSATGATSSAPGRHVEVEVYAAASLHAALEQAKAAYEAANPGTVVVVSTDSSAALETKIEQGAPADLFLAADTSNPQKLVDAGFASGVVTPFARNSLAVIVPTDNPARIRTPADIANEGVKIVAAGDAVPITRYAGQLVQNLAATPGYPADFPDRYAANVGSREDNVSAVLTKVGLGEADAGIVYVTDAMGSDDVVRVEIPESANVQATYGGVVLMASSDREAATAFLAWLAGPEGHAVLRDLGFLPPGP